MVCNLRHHVGTVPARGSATRVAVALYMSIQFGYARVTARPHMDDLSLCVVHGEFLSPLDCSRDHVL